MIDLYTILKTSNLPVAYHHFAAPPTPPYIVYLAGESNNFGADNRVYTKIQGYQVELYNTKKDIAKENLIEGIFDANDIFYDKSEEYIESEGLYEVLYLISI